MKFRLYRAADGLFRWDLLAGRNGVVLATSRGSDRKDRLVAEVRKLNPTISVQDDAPIGTWGRPPKRSATR